MLQYNFKNFIKCYSLHVRKWFCGLLAAQIILIPNYSFAQINSDITVQQMNNSFGVSAFDLTNYNLALNLNFGNKNPDTTYGALTAIYRGLAQAFGPAYYYEIQNNTLNSPARYSETQNVLRSLQAVEQNQWYMNQNLISSDNHLSNLDTKLTIQNSLLTTQNNLLYDYNHIGDSSFSVGTTSRNTAVNTSNIYQDLHNINWNNTNIVSTVSVSTSFNQSNPIYPNTSNALSPGTYYLKLPNFPYDTSNYDTNLFRFDIPFRTQWTSLFNKNWITNISVLVDNENTVYQGDYYWDIDVMKNGQYYLRFYFLDFIPYHNNTLVIKFTTTDTWLYTSDDIKYVWYLPSSSPDYLAFNDYVNLKRLQAKDFTASISGDVQMDTTDLENKIDDVINAIDDVSLVNNNVKLNLNINNNTSSDGSNIIGRLQNFFNNGTSISDFFDNVDDAESGWFNQTNSDLINTLSGGYVNLYE